MKLSAQESQHSLNNQKSTPQHFNLTPGQRSRACPCPLWGSDNGCLLQPAWKVTRSGLLWTGGEADSRIFPMPHRRHPTSTSVSWSRAGPPPSTAVTTAGLTGHVLGGTTVNPTDLPVILLLPTAIQFTRNRYSGFSIQIQE